MNQDDVIDAMRVLDLFCGCGGMSQGLMDAGLDVVAGIDIWDAAINTYKENFQHAAICEDLKSFSPQDFDNNINHKLTIDIIVGGPPCQGFSIAGKRESSDPRNSLFMEFCKYIDYFKPKAFIMENVIGILSMKTESGESVMDIILSNFNNYNCSVFKLNACDFEVPQSRRRVIIMGIRSDLNIKPTEPKPVGSLIPVGSILLPRESVDAKCFLSTRAITGINNKKAKSKERGVGFGAQYLNLDKPCYTIPARYWKDGYDALVKYSDTEIRRLTIEELKRVQTFPNNFKFVGTKKDIIIQIGNAVACRFAYHLGVHIKALL